MKKRDTVDSIDKVVLDAAKEMHWTPRYMKYLFKVAWQLGRDEFINAWMKASTEASGPLVRNPGAIFNTKLQEALANHKSPTTND